MKIINIANFPPPIGGVSCFLKRLKTYTDAKMEKDFVYVDVSGKEKERKRKNGIICIWKINIIFLLLFEKSALIVFHSNSIGHLFLHWIFRKKHRFIYFTHGESILKEKNRVGWRYKLLSSAEAVVTPTKELYEKTRIIFGEKCDVRFIPFIIYPKDVKPYKSEVINSLRKKVDVLFSGYANSLAEFQNNDLYGVDMMIELIYGMNHKGYNVGAVILISNINNINKYEEYKKKIRESHIEDKIVILTQPMEEASALYLASDVYLRPTNTDGDSFSIWEALHLGIPVLASDATQRPEGCILFKNRNQDDFEEKAIKIIKEYKDLKKTVAKLNINGNEKEILNFLMEKAK